MQTILNYDCFPAGMELFPAMDEKQFEYIKRIIDDSDYYLLIIGGRYGSEDAKGVSWTEREYNYAVKKKIPVLVFDHQDFTKLSADKTDQKDKKRKKLIAFKKKVSTGRLINYWTDAKDLDAVVAKSLHKVLEEKPMKGWIKVDSFNDGFSQEEINRLKKEINTLEKDKAQLEKELKKANKKIKDFEATQKEVCHSSTRPLTESFTVRGVTFNMVHVEGGTFRMGANNHDSNAQDNEKPAHDVTLSDYWIGETLVTQALWQAVMGDNPSNFTSANGYTDDLNRPVECVNWMKCQEFIEKLGYEEELREKLNGREFHLPTEAQWEYAARGGIVAIKKKKNYKYAGRSFDVDKVAYYRKNSGGQTHPVAEKDPNDLGLYDMSGNVWEWCEDVYGDYSNKKQTDPRGPENASSTRVFRGGSWQNGDWRCRVSHRDGTAQMNEDVDLGLRLVLY